jgi:flavin-dependent dehydrogenase
VKRLDVAIVGGGLAGGLLARQLRRALPELRVALFEKSTAPGFKVGEATVEIAANHLIRKQGLSQYLYESQLPKNGLRYFFDSPDRDQALPEMSEVGSVNLPFHPAFQIDRARMETDLLEMNRRDGVEVHTGVRVEGIELGEDGAAHRFVARDAHGARSCAARWLVDAAGRGGLLARPLGLRVAEDRHRVGSVWGRFEGVADIDEVGPETFRTRVRHTSRRLSTIHFMYPGYWIWMIPLRGGLISVGVTGEEVGKRRELRTAEGLRGFLGRHRAVAELMADAKGVDLGSCARIAYGTRRYFHADRWALVGEAASAADPLYSPGSDFIALANDLLTEVASRATA